jgi:acyl-CoA thioester hydrolase
METLVASNGEHGREPLATAIRPMRDEFPEPKPEQAVEELVFRVCMRDVDHANIYYSAYYEWMDRSFSEFLHRAGHSLREVFASGLGIPIVESRCSYLAPVSLDDLIRIRMWISKLGRTSFVMTYDFTRVGDGVRVARGWVTHVWVKRPEMQPVPVPDWFRRRAPAEVGQ